MGKMGFGIFLLSLWCEIPQMEERDVSSRLARRERRHLLCPRRVDMKVALGRRGLTVDFWRYLTPAFSAGGVR